MKHYSLNVDLVPDRYAKWDKVSKTLYEARKQLTELQEEKEEYAREIMRLSDLLRDNGIPWLKEKP